MKQYMIHFIKFFYLISFSYLSKRKECSALEFVFESKFWDFVS